MATEEETPKERTKRMLHDARQETLRHEEMRKANQGKSQFPLAKKLKLAIPLFVIAYGLYTFSIVQFRKQIRQYNEREGNDIKVITDPRDMDVPEEQYKHPDMTLSDFYKHFGPAPKNPNDEEALTDSDLQWSQKSN